MNIEFLDETDTGLSPMGVKREPLVGGGVTVTLQNRTAAAVLRAPYSHS